MDESCAPNMSIYLPVLKSGEGPITNFTDFVLPSLNKTDSSLYDQDEFPKSPVGVKVAEAVILTLSAEINDDGVINTSMLAESPFLIVISCWDVWTENGRVRLWSTLPILFSDHSVNQTSLLL